jgi:hypothetical protein
MSKIIPSQENIFFFWGGGISDTRLKILKDSLYSTRVFNPKRPIYLITNTLKQEQFDDKFEIQVLQWDNSFFDELPLELRKIDSYKKASHREFCDLFRLILLYKFGGSYIDTDDIALAPIVDISKQNIVCRSYDPHTCHYNKILPIDCVPGMYREVRGYDDITIFPRNDCWLNFKPKSNFIYDIITNEKFKNYEGVIYIGDDFSWQSLTLDTCKKHLEKIGEEFNLFLTLLYLYEGFVAGSSYYDRCHFGGEFCDLWKQLENVNNYDWGKYKCKKEIALSLLEITKQKFPYVSHLWMHDKDMNSEWMLGELLEDEVYSPSTWIINHIRTQINSYNK